MSKLFFNEKESSYSSPFQSWSFGKLNYMLFFAGLFSIILGYIIMFLGSVNSFQSLTFAPILLSIGYFILIPLSLLLKSKDSVE